VVSRHRLDVDELSLFYSTDFPTGGTELVDIQNNETLENPTTNLSMPDEDYRFETRVWSDLTAGGTKNQSLLSPWNFDTNDGGFRSGILTATDYTTITNVISQWGEDLNFNDVDDKRCTDDPGRICLRDSDCLEGTCESLEQRDPADGVLDKNWNIRGGCGWQTRPPGTCENLPTQGCFDDGDCPGSSTCTGPSTTGGIWHTGRIGGMTGVCLTSGLAPGQCQTYEIVGGSSGLRRWYEALVTPVIEKVNGDTYQVEILDWAWNQAIDLADRNVALAWEFDTDSSSRDPVDLFDDDVTLNYLWGPYGAVTASNDPTPTGGFSLFAPLDAPMLDSTNGTLGNNREGRNTCYFEEGAIPVSLCPNCPAEPGDLGWSGPLDDDLDNDTDGQIDEFVTANGPIRNMDISANDGPDMRFTKLEDLYGETGDTFQAALSLLTFEAAPYDPPNTVGYGVGVDDMVVQWREFTLAPDEVDCAAGECAVISLRTHNLFESRTAVTVTVLEKSPDPANDCDLDGSPEATIDCDGDGIRDVVAEVTSQAEVDGEIVILNATGNPSEFKGELAISTSFDAAGSLFVAPVDGENPTITAAYLDNDDGTGQVCGNVVDPALQGRLEASATVLVIDTGEVVVVSTVAADNGDDDGFPDTNETVELRIRLWNRSDVDLTGLTARLRTSDPKLDCVFRSSVYIGDLPAGTELWTTNGFVFRVADIDRTASGLTDLDDLSSSLDIMFSADQFDVNLSPQSVVLDLDLDATGGRGPTTFFEGFESGTLGTFTANNMDRNLGSLEAADGYRCQYSDPDWINSNSYGVINDCYPTAGQQHADTFWWNVYAPATFGGRAFSGAHSLYYGEYPPAAADSHTTPTATLEAVELTDPVNLGFLDQPPELSFKHMADLIDHRTVTAPPGLTSGRAVVQLQLADGDSDPVGNWIKLQPYLNVYDQQGVDNYFNCVFDPIDDGSTEDDFFDPTDPDRRLGPSSTCMSEFAFAHQGDTFHPFSETAIGLASHGPGLKGSLGVGTWIETKVNLERFRGRRVRLRFLATDLKLGSTGTWEQAFTMNPSPGDDGWWIDDVTLTNTLATPATITNDDKDNSHLPLCGNVCNTVTAQLAADPPGILPAPGRVVALSALDSVADRCLDGVLQFRFGIDGDADGTGGGSQDTLLRGWTDVPEILQVPQQTTTYVVEVRCSSDTTCVDSASRTIVVNCPSSGSLTFPTVVAPDRDTLEWGDSITHDFAMGPLAGLTTYATSASGQDLGPASSFDIAGDTPAVGSGLWYLFRKSGPLGEGDTGFCNAPGITWGGASRDAALP
jgi:hypothetical protein